MRDSLRNIRGNRQRKQRMIKKHGRKIDERAKGSDFSLRLVVIHLFRGVTSVSFFFIKVTVIAVSIPSSWLARASSVSRSLSENKPKIHQYFSDQHCETIDVADRPDKSKRIIYTIFPSRVFVDNVHALYFCKYKEYYSLLGNSLRRKLESSLRFTIKCVHVSLAVTRP